MASDVDAPDHPQTWSVESTDDGDKFQVAGGFVPTLSFKDQPDFETPTDVGMNNTYVVTVRVTDERLSRNERHAHVHGHGDRRQ